MHLPLRRLTRKLREKSGQALVSTLIVVGLVAIFATTILSSTNAVHQGMNTQFYKNDLEGFSHVLLGIVNNPFLCSAMFKFNTPGNTINGGPASPTPVQEMIIDDTNKKILTSSGGGPGAIISNTSPQNIVGIPVQVVDVQFVMPNPPIPAPSPAPSQIIYNGNLTIATQATAPNIYIPANRRVVAQISVTIDSTTGVLVSCAANMTTADVCATMGGIYDNTLNPACRFGIGDVTCPSINQIITNVDSTTNPATVTCASGDVLCPCMSLFPGCVSNTERQLMIGFAGGQPICTDAVNVTGCTVPGGTTWTQGPYTCTLMSSVLLPSSAAPQQPVPATAPSPAPTGIGYFKCAGYTLTGPLATSTCAPLSCAVPAGTTWTDISGTYTCGISAPATIPGTGVGSSVPSSDPSPAPTGLGSFSCLNGTLTGPFGTSTCAPLNCVIPAGTTWTDPSGTYTCTTAVATSVPGTGVGDSIPSSAPSPAPTGIGQFTCSNGTLSAPLSTSTCTPTVCTVPAGTTWTDITGTYTCTITADATIPDSGSAQNVPSSAPSPAPTGVGQFSCSGGTLTGPLASSTCAPTVCSVPAGSTWTDITGTFSCNTTVATTIPDDGSVNNIPSTAPSPSPTGVGQYSCLGGAVTGPLSSSTCAPP